MHGGKLVFAQLMEHLPWKTFGRIVERYGGDHRVRGFSCAHQFRCMVAFAQLTYRESLRDLATWLRAQSAKLYRLGLRGTVARCTLADANEARNLRSYAEFPQHLTRIARRLHLEEPFPWAPSRSTTAAIKLHTLIDLRGNFPTFNHISDGNLHDVNVLDHLLPEPAAFYVMNRGYLDFERLHRWHLAGAFFVTRAKSNLKAKRRYSHPVDRAAGLICDQTIALTVHYSKAGYHDALRRIRFMTDEANTLVFPDHQLHVARPHQALSLPSAV
jgi:hypothetical protein